MESKIFVSFCWVVADDTVIRAFFYYHRTQNKILTFSQLLSNNECKIRAINCKIHAFVAINTKSRIHLFLSLSPLTVKFTPFSLLWPKCAKSLPFFMAKVSSTLRQRNVTITVHFWFVFEETSSRAVSWLLWSSFQKGSVFKFFSSTRKGKVAFSNSSGLKSVFKKLRFCDGLVWTEDLTVEIKLRFRIASA